MRRSPLLCLALLPLALCAQGTITVQLVDYAAVPQSGELVNSPDNAVYVARVNFLREEPGGGLNRFFVCDLNGKLYVLDQTTRQFTTYLDFQRNPAESPTATGLFPAFTRAAGYANGLVTFQFDPEYRVSGSANFGKFYTVHIEVDTNDGDARRLPNASGHPGFANAATYAATNVHEAPGNDNASTRQAVLIEWQDANPANATFEGTARELLRIEFNGRIHPTGDLLFNPLATNASHADWRKLYIAVGDGGAGEQNNAVLHATPQRLDGLQGKILRITPDDPDGAGPLRYGIPADNPFAAAAAPGTRGEIYAYGFRNPHRISWDAETNLLLAADIGFHTWEEVNIVRRGGNYGWGDREGTHFFDVTRGVADRFAGGAPDPIGPILQYPHSPALGYGDAIAGGFIYRGTRLPSLRGKYVFGDITTGQLFYADVEFMRSVSNLPGAVASFDRIELLWDNPRNAAAAERFDRMYEIVAEGYRARGGPLTRLPGSATVSDLTGGGRADIRLAVDHNGELYLLSKSDGMIRALTADVAPTAPPTLTRLLQPQLVAEGSTAVFFVEATNAAAYRWSWIQGNVLVTAASTGPYLVLPNVGRGIPTDITVLVSNGFGSIGSGARLSFLTTANPGRVANFSIRSQAGTGAETLTVGLAVGGGTADAPAPSLLVRGVGPGLAPFGVTGFLADPRLELFRGRTLIAENDNWDVTSPVAAAAAQVGAFALSPRSGDAALLQAGLAADSYTMQITPGASVPPTATGVALAEVFDATTPGTTSRQLVNVSARTQVSTGDNALIAGFVIGGFTARTVLIRAAGPALGAFGVTGTLADPKLTLFRGTTPIAENDNWLSDPELINVFAQVGAFGFIARAKDAALLLTLAPGSYTAQVTGAGANPSGVALVEVYVLP